MGLDQRKRNTSALKCCIAKHSGCLRGKLSSKMLTCLKTCSRMLSTVLHRPYKYNIEKDIAAFIKKEFDKKYNPTWHAIVGRNFGSYVTHETKHFIYFYLGQVAILLFKSG